MTSILAYFNIDANFKALLNMICITERGVSLLISDGFTSANEFTIHLIGDIDALDKHLVQKNRIYSTVASVTRFRFTQTIISTLKGILFYLTIAKI